MDTKLKNYHKLTAVIMALVILLPSLAMMVIRPHYIRQQNNQTDSSYTDSELMYQLIKDCYVLYGEEVQNESGKALRPYDIFFGTGSKQETESDFDNDKEDSEYSDSESVAYDMENRYDDWESDFSTLRTYMEYDVLDTEDKGIIDTNRESTDKSHSLYQSLSRMRSTGVLDKNSEYAFAAFVEYGKSGTVKSTAFLSHQKDNASQMLNEIAKQNPVEDYEDYYNFQKPFQKPS